MDLSVFHIFLVDLSADIDIVYFVGLCILAGAFAAAAFVRNLFFSMAADPVKMHGLVTTTLSPQGLVALQGGTHRPPWKAQPLETEVLSAERYWTEPVHSEVVPQPVHEVQVFAQCLTGRLLVFWVPEQVPSGTDSDAMRCCSQRAEAVPSWAPPICCLCPRVCSQWLVCRCCLVGDCAHSLFLPCVVESVPEHDPVLVRWETENKQLDREKEDGLQMCISWHEARWNWYRAHSSVPDLSQFQAPVVSASSGALASASMPAALVSHYSPASFLVASSPTCFAGISLMVSATVATRARLHTRLQHSTVRRITAKFQWQSRLRNTVVPPVMTSASGVDCVRDGVFGPGLGILVPTLGCPCRQPGVG